MSELNELVRKAVKGDKAALEEVVLDIQDYIYNLAIRMLWHPDEASDATQEILIRVVTNLGSFEQKSSFTTWVYRLASNSLINFKKKNEARKLSFEKYAKQLNQGFAEDIRYSANDADRNMLVTEAKVGCSNAMLQCLDNESRLTYILGEILDFNSLEGAAILDIRPENFRKKLSRARSKLHSFLQGNCGIVNPTNACRCHKKVDHAIAEGHINPEKLLFANQHSNELVTSIDTMEREVALFRTNPDYDTPERLLNEVRRLITKQPIHD